MLGYTLEKLIAGDREVVGYYQNARELWTEIMHRPEARTTGSLASLVTSMQPRFEQRCGGRFIGQEIMAFVGIGQFYTTDGGFNGHSSDAAKVRDALLQSFCSIEVKWHTRAAATSYALEEDR